MDEPDTRAQWQFWIDRGGTFTDIVARRPDGTLRHAQAAVRESRALSRTRRCRASASCSASPPARRFRRGASTRSRWARRSRPTRCSSARASARLLVDHARLRRRAAHRLPEPTEALRAPDRAADAALRARDRGRRAHRRARRGACAARSRRGASATCARRSRDGIRAVAIVLMHGYRYPAARAGAGASSRARSASRRCRCRTRSAR